jgi:hypothetical protein
VTLRGELTGAGHTVAIEHTFFKPEQEKEESEWRPLDRIANEIKTRIERERARAKARVAARKQP